MHFLCLISTFSGIVYESLCKFSFPDFCTLIQVLGDISALFLPSLNIIVCAHSHAGSGYGGGGSGNASDSLHYAHCPVATVEPL